MTAKLKQDFSIHPGHEVFYLRSIFLAAHKSVMGFQNYYDLLENENSQPEDIIFELQEALSQAASV